MCHPYDAECALHVAHQTHVDAWITAASDRLHEAATDNLESSHTATPTTEKAPANDSTKEQRLMTTSLTAWPNTRDVSPPTDHLYRSATWLLGRHPRLALLAARIRGVVMVEDGELAVDLDHLADALSAPRAVCRRVGGLWFRHR